VVILDGIPAVVTLFGGSRLAGLDSPGMANSKVAARFCEPRHNGEGGNRDIPTETQKERIRYDSM
jgi:hypothetical protein